MGLFSKNTETKVNDKQLSGDSTVSEWLAHPVGGALFREMLKDAGQKESVLFPVKNLPLRKLIPMSGGKFTEKTIEDMVSKVNSNNTETNSSEVDEKSNEQKAVKTWSEKITADRFVGKTIIVTGAGSGIGRAVASRIAREGGNVIAVDISEERLNELRSLLNGHKISVIVGDITNESDINKIVSSCGDKVDGLANVAGIMDNMTPVHEVSNEIWDKVIAVNLTGMMKLSRAILPIMLKNGNGSIVNVGSEASIKGSVAGAAYTASKHAVVGLTKSSAFMYGPKGIRVNLVAPGAVMTNIQASFESKLGEERVSQTLSSMTDLASPEQLAASITFLLSDDSVNINGAILTSDGGWSIQ